MYKTRGTSYSKRIRKLLRLPAYQAGDGLTAETIARIMAGRSDTTRDSLKRMPDAYIATWLPATPTARPSAHWKVVIPPPNARPPEKKLTKNRGKKSAQ